MEIRQRTIRRDFKIVITSRGAIPYTMQHRMKRYYLQGKEISEKQAKAIEAKNQKYISSNDFTLWAKCQFVTVMNTLTSFSTITADVWERLSLECATAYHPQKR